MFAELTMKLPTHSLETSQNGQWSWRKASQLSTLSASHEMKSSWLLRRTILSAAASSVGSRTENFPRIGHKPNRSSRKLLTMPLTRARTSSCELYRGAGKIPERFPNVWSLRSSVDFCSPFITTLNGPEHTWAETRLTSV